MFKVEIKSEENEDICIVVKVDNHSYNYICECGQARNLTVKECQNANAIFISHTHIDHFINFDTILRHQIGIQRTVVIVGPQGIIDQVQHRIKSYCWNLIEEDSIAYEIREVISSDRYKSALLRPPYWEKENERNIESSNVFVEDNFSIRCTVLDHKTDSLAFLFVAEDKIKIDLTNDFLGGRWVSELKNAYEKGITDQEIEVNGTLYTSQDLFHLLRMEKGTTLGVIMDHAPSTENHNKIESLFADRDRVYIESFYRNEDMDLAIKNHHSYAAKSGEIMNRCNIKQAIPVHFSRKYESDDIQALIAEFQVAYNN